MSFTIIYLIAGGFFTGFVDAIAGGGGLISLPLLLSLNLPPVMALGTNKFMGIAASATSSLRYTLARQVEWTYLWPAVCMALLGSALGAVMASYLDPSFLTPLVLLGLLSLAIYSLFPKNFRDLAHGVKKRSTQWLLAVGSGMGFYDGFFGPGTGSFLMLIYMRGFGQSLLKASAWARVTNLASNAGALGVFAYLAKVEWQFAFLGALSASLGAWVGAQISLRRGAKLIRPVYVVVVWVMLLRLLLRYFENIG